MPISSENISHETSVIHPQEEDPNSNVMLHPVNTPPPTLDETTDEPPIATISVNVNEVSSTLVTVNESSDPHDDITEDFSKKSKEELYDLCKQRNLKVSQRMKKKELLETLQSKEIVLTKLTKEELKKIGKDRNIKGLSGKSKEELVQILSSPKEETKNMEEIEHNEEQVNPTSDPIEFVHTIRQLEETPETASIYDMTLEELQDLCKSKGMKTFKRRRNELIEWLEMNNENEEFDQYLTDNENVL